MNIRKEAKKGLDEFLRNSGIFLTWDSCLASENTFVCLLDRRRKYNDSGIEFNRLFQFILFFNNFSEIRFGNTKQM